MVIWLSVSGCLITTMHMRIFDNKTQTVFPPSYCASLYTDQTGLRMLTGWRMLYVVRWLILNISLSSHTDGVINDMLMKNNLFQVNTSSFDGFVAFSYKGHIIYLYHLFLSSRTDHLHHLWTRRRRKEKKE